MNIEVEDFEYILNDKNIDFSVFQGKTVLIAGATGMLPAYMVKTLLYQNSLEKFPPTKLICLVRSIRKAKKCFCNFINDENLLFIEQDVINPICIKERIDYIIHAASKASGKFFYSDPVGVINANTIGTYILLNLAKEKNVKSFLYFSSGEVNGDIYSKQELVKESDYGIINPYDIRNCYAMGKKVGESLCYCYYYQYNIPAKAVRPSHTYGPGFNESDDRAFAQFVMAAVNKNDIILKTKGNAKRSFVYISDAVRAYFNVLLNGKDGEAYNVSNNREMSIKELALLISKISGEIKIKFDLNSENESSVSLHGLEDITKIKSLGWTPVIDEQEGFRRTIEFYQSKKDFKLNKGDYAWEEI